MRHSIRGYFKWQLGNCPLLQKQNHFSGFECAAGGRPVGTTLNASVGFLVHNRLVAFMLGQSYDGLL